MTLVHHIWQRAKQRTGQALSAARASRSRRKVALTRRTLRWEALESRELLVVNLVSASITGGSGERGSVAPQISRDGRYVVFESTANNLVAGDSNASSVTDIFRRDLVTGTTVLVTPNTVGGGGGNGSSSNPVISADGRYVAFQSSASNLVTGDSNGMVSDIFLRDLTANTTTVITRNFTLNGTAGGSSTNPSISRDGRFVVFQSQAVDLVAPPQDTNGSLQDVFLWDSTTPNAMTLLSVAFNVPASGNGPSSNPVIAGNGGFVVFSSQAANLVASDSNGSIQDVFVRPVGAGAISLVSAGLTAGSGAGASGGATISDDGAFIGFTSLANNLVANDNNSFQDVYIRNRAANTTALASIDRNGQFAGQGTSGNASISRDGRFVAFTSMAANIVANDVNGTTQDVFVRDRVANTTRLVSVNTAGNTANNGSGEPDISFDGRYVTFSSLATDLTVTDTTSSIQNVFRRDLTANATLLVSRSMNGNRSGNGTSTAPRIDDSGQNIAFVSAAFDLAPNDTNFNIQDVFRFTPTAPSSTQSMVTGPDRGMAPNVRVLDAGNFTERQAILPYNAGFGGGVRVATADISGDGVLDFITAAGPGGGPHVKVFDGVTGVQLAGAIGSFFAYHPNFSGGVYVAAADVTGDGRPDIITGAGAGGGPHVKVFNGATGAEVSGFFAYHPNFGGGVTVATGDVDADGRADIITGAGPGGGPHVRVISGLTGAEIRGFFAYASNFAGGVFVSAGDINNDGRADVVTGAGAGTVPQVRVVNVANGAELLSFFALPLSFTGGVRVATVDANSDGRIDIVTASGPGIQTTLRVFNGINGAQLSENTPYPGFFGGLFVAGTIAGLPGGSPLRAEGGVHVGEPLGSLLDDASLDAMVGVALARLSASGLSDVAVTQLENTSVEIADLPGDLLGWQTPEGILLDRDAAGYGWLIDAVSEDGIDLIAALTHEWGHALRLDDLDPQLHAANVMASRLGPSARRVALEAVDAVFQE